MPAPMPLVALTTRTALPPNSNLIGAICSYASLLRRRHRLEEAFHVRLADFFFRPILHRWLREFAERLDLSGREHRDLHADLLEDLFGVLVLLARHFAMNFDRLARAIFDRFFLRCRKTLEKALVDQVGVDAPHMAVERDVLLALVEARSEDVGHAVFLTIYDLLLQRCRQFSPRNG